MVLRGALVFSAARTRHRRGFASDWQTLGRPINPQPLLDFATNRQRHAPARRLALELVERLRPGTSRLLIAGWLDDRFLRQRPTRHRNRLPGMQALQGL